MGLPSTRELELEALLRLRDTQLTNLTDEVAHLRQFLTCQPGSSTSDPVTLPPSLASLLLPHIISSSSDGTSGSGTVAAALTQRAQLLQEENDELYDILKHGETGRLREEVRGLRRVVERLEKALGQSHTVIETLSTELEKTYSTFLTSTKQTATSPQNTKASPRSPRNSYYPVSRSTTTGNGREGGKMPPTGPRAHKKPRLSEPRASTPTRSSALQNTTREHAPRHESSHRGKSQYSKMDVDNGGHRRSPSPPHERVRERERERGPKERDRDREGRNPRRNGNFSGAGRGGGPGGRRTERTDRNTTSTNFSGDRTLAERLGL